MTDITSLATKYRPQCFADVVGQDSTVNILKSFASSTNGIPVRSIFLKGSWGSGKTTLARIFAKAMNCEKFKEIGDVCNECKNCKDVMSENSGLYFEFDSASVGNVDTIRNFPTMFGYKPNGRRVVVLDECHAVSSAAATALLKIIEDGIKDTTFIFCSTEDILPTLKSRSVVLDINPIPAESIIKRVRYVAEQEHISITEEDLHILAMKSKGHMRDALSILQLYAVSGKYAVSSSLKDVQHLIVDATSGKKNRSEIISKILRYPVLDIKNSFQIVVRDSFCLEIQDAIYSYIRQRKLHIRLFQIFNANFVQNSLRDEVGMEIFLNYLYDTI